MDWFFKHSIIHKSGFKTFNPKTLNHNLTDLKGIHKTPLCAPKVLEKCKN